MLTGHVEQEALRSRGEAAAGALRHQWSFRNRSEAHSASPSRSYRGLWFCEALGEELRQPDPDRELGLFLAVELAGLGHNLGNDLRLGQARPLRRVNHQAKFVMEPARQRASAPILLEEFTGWGQIQGVNRRRRLLRQELLELIPLEL